MGWLVVLSALAAAQQIAGPDFRFARWGDRPSKIMKSEDASFVGFNEGLMWFEARVPDQISLTILYQFEDNELFSGAIHLDITHEFVEDYMTDYLAGVTSLEEIFGPPIGRHRQWSKDSPYTEKNMPENLAEAIAKGYCEITTVFDSKRTLGMVKMGAVDGKPTVLLLMTSKLQRTIKKL